MTTVKTTTPATTAAPAIIAIDKSFFSPSSPVGGGRGVPMRPTGEDGEVVVGGEGGEVMIGIEETEGK